MKNTILTIWFNIGVNVIGLPEWHKHTLTQGKEIRSKFHK